MSTNISIIPQKISFSKDKITTYDGKIIHPGLNVDITLDAYNIDKTQLKEDLQQIFTEVLGYFD